MAVAPGVLLIPLYTRYLTPETFGAFSLVTIYGTLLVYVLDLGLATAFVRRYYAYTDEDVHERKRLVSTVLWTLIATSTLIAVPVYLAAGTISQMLLVDYPGVTLVRLMTATVFVTTMAAVPMSVLRVTERPGTFLWLAALRGTSVLVIVPVLLVWLRSGAEGIFAGQLLAATLAAGAGGIVTARHYGLTFSAADGRALFGMGLVFWPSMILNWVIDFSDAYFLRHFHALDEVAVYAVGYKVAQLVFYAVLAFSIGWSPILFGILRDADAQAVLAKMFRFYVLGLASLGFVIALFAQEIVGLLAPAIYARAAPIAAALCAAYVFYGLFVFFLSGVVIAGRYMFQSMALAVGALVNLVLNLALIPVYGMGGAAASTLCAFATTAGLGYWFAQRLFRVPYRWRDGGTVVVCVAGGCASYLIAVSLGLNAPVAKIGAVLSYAALLIGTGGVSVRELRAVASLWAQPTAAT